MGDTWQWWSAWPLSSLGSRMGGWIPIRGPGCVDCHPNSRHPEDWETPFRQCFLSIHLPPESPSGVSSRKLANAILQPPCKKQLFLPETKLEEAVFVASQTLLNKRQPTGAISCMRPLMWALTTYKCILHHRLLCQPLPLSSKEGLKVESGMRSWNEGHLLVKWLDGVSTSQHTRASSQPLYMGCVVGEVNLIFVSYIQFSVYTGKREDPPVPLQLDEGTLLIFAKNDKWRWCWLQWFPHLSELGHSTW